MQNMLWLSMMVLGLFLPALAYAHGDDEVTAASFIGPLVVFFVFVTVVGLGKAILRMIIRRA